MKLQTLATLALAVSQESKCPSHKVGAIILKDGRVVSTGYNGTIKGCVNPDTYAMERGWCDPLGVLYEKHSNDYSLWANDNVIHAEMNAILFAAKESGGIDGSTMVTSVSPCSNCRKHIKAAGIKTLIYVQEYNRSVGTGWVEDLESAGIEVIHAPLFYQDYVVKCNRKNNEV